MHGRMSKYGALSPASHLSCRRRAEYAPCKPCGTAIRSSRARRRHQECRLEPFKLNAVSVDASEKYMTTSEVMDVAKARGLNLSVSELGPFYRVTCRDDVDDKILAVTNGWVAPLFKYMHCETLQVFTKGLSGDNGERIRGGPLGLGLLVGACTFAYAHEKGITCAEILAIKDYDDQHKRLVRYYRYFGLVPVKEVGDNGVADLLDQVVWGGVGTKMQVEPIFMLEKWSRALRNSQRKGKV